jgi:outer membrane murein-binding lipoprotein Lpp
MNRTRRWMKPMLVAMTAALAANLFAGCINAREAKKRELARFVQTVQGEYINDQGNSLMIAAVYARMIGLDTLYVERTANGQASGRIVSLEIAGDSKKILQLGLVFTQPGQWRDVRNNPELFSALLPKDVRAAGTCDIKLSEDMNTITYGCGGSVPESFTRAMHGAPN